MDLLLRRVAESERLAALTAADAGATSGCLPEWVVLARAAGAPGVLAAWWMEHGNSCAACAWSVERVARENSGQAQTIRTVCRISSNGLEQRVRLRSLRRPSSRLAWAAATPALPTRNEPLPAVSFHAVAPVPEAGVVAVWVVAWDERFFILVAGDESATGRWRGGARAIGPGGDIVARFAPAQLDRQEALCPSGHIGGMRCVCLESQAGLVTESPIALPGLVAGTLRFEPDDAPEASLEAAILDLTSRNRISRFLDAVGPEPEDAGTTMAVEFYLRLLSAQGRVPEESRRRIAELHWTTQETRRALLGAPS